MENTTRSAWNKSIHQAMQAVIAGTMTADEFRAVALPSPDCRDQSPEIRLQMALKTKETRDAQSAQDQDRRRRNEEQRALLFEKYKNECVWVLCGFPMEHTTSPICTLSELRAWARSYGYVFSGDRTGFSAVAVADDGYDQDMALMLEHDIDLERPFRFVKAAQHLANWIKDYREYVGLDAAQKK